MIVFKTILKILNKLKGMIILYTIILIAITTLNQKTENNIGSFEEEKPDILIINKDNENEITKSFIEYLGKYSNLKDIDINDEEKIDDAIFYRDVNFAIYIPNNFGEDLINGNNPVIEYKSCGDEYSSYSKMIIEKYIKTIALYSKYYKGKELIDNVNNILQTDINVEMKTTLDTTKLSSMNKYFNFLNYAFLAGCVYCVSMILSSLNEENVKKRTIISSFNYKKYNRIVILSNAIVVLIMWTLYMILSFILFKNLMITPNGLLYIANSFVFAICGLSIGNLIGNIIKDKNAIGGIINVVALGSSFLCGCFVPFEYMPDYVIKVAHIFPTYYYVINNEMIRRMEIFNFQTIKQLLLNMIVVIIFSLIFISITNYITKKRRQKNN